MKKTLLVLSLAVYAIAAIAAPPAKPVPVKCPVCHMVLSTKKTKENTVAVRLKKGGPIYYCCAKCKMPASVLVTPPKKK